MTVADENAIDTLGARYLEQPGQDRVAGIYEELEVIVIHKVSAARLPGRGPGTAPPRTRNLTCLVWASCAARHHDPQCQGTRVIGGARHACSQMFVRSGSTVMSGRPLLEPRLPAPAVIVERP